VNLVALDITLNGHRYGQWFDFVVDVSSGDTRNLDNAKQQAD
jgi:hypothetical protein